MSTEILIERRPITSEFYSNLVTREVNYPYGSYCDIETRNIYLEDDLGNAELQSRIAEHNLFADYSAQALESFISDSDETGEVDTERLNFHGLTPRGIS